MVEWTVDPYIKSRSQQNQNSLLYGSKELVEKDLHAQEIVVTMLDNVYSALPCTGRLDS